MRTLRIGNLAVTDLRWAPLRIPRPMSPSTGCSIVQKSATTGSGRMETISTPLLRRDPVRCLCPSELIHQALNHHRKAYGSEADHRRLIPPRQARRFQEVYAQRARLKILGRQQAKVGVENHPKSNGMLYPTLQKLIYIPPFSKERLPAKQVITRSHVRRQPSKLLHQTTHRPSLQGTWNLARMPSFPRRWQYLRPPRRPLSRIVQDLAR